MKIFPVQINFYKLSLSLWIIGILMSMHLNAQSLGRPLGTEEINQAASDTLVQQPSAALELAKQAFVLSRKNKNTSQEELSLLIMGRAYYLMGKPDKSVEQLNRCITSARKSGNRKAEAGATLVLADIQKDQGKYDKSLDMHRQCLEWFGEVRDSAGIAETNRSLGSLEWRMGNFESAYQHYSLAFAYGSAIQSPGFTAQCLNGMGTAARDLGEFQKSEEHFARAKSIYRQMHDSLHLAGILNLEGSLYQRMQQYEKAQVSYDSACRMYSAANNRKELAKTLRNEGAVYRQMRIPDKAFSCFHEAASIFLSLKDSSEYARTLIQTGISYLRDRNYAAAHQSFLDALRVCLVSSRIPETVEAYNNLGLLFYETGNYPAAISNHQKAVKSARTLNDKAKLRYSLGLLGNDYFEAGDIDQALTAYTEGYELTKESNDSRETALAAKNLARIKSRRKAYSGAIDLLKQSVDLYAKTGYHDGILQAENEMVNVYTLTKQTGTALSVLENGIKESREWKNDYFLALFNRKSADLLMGSGIMPQAGKRLEESLALGMKLKNPEIIALAYQSLSEYYQKTGNPALALAYFRKYSDERDSIDSRKQVEKLAMDQLNFDLGQKNAAIEKMEQQVQVLENEKTIKDLSLRQQKLLRNFAIVAALFLLIVALLLYNRYALKKKKEKQLEDHLQTINSMNQRLRASELELKALNASKDKFFSIIAHDIKNPLTGLMGFSEHIRRNYKEMNPDELLDVAEIMYTASRNLYALLENLLTWSRLQTGRMPHEPETFDLSDLTGQIISLQQANALQKGISVITEGEKTKVYADRNMIHLVLRNLLSNAIKFTPSGGYIRISSLISGKMVEVSVTDNGLGMSDDEQQQLFRVDGYFTTRGTGNEEGTGLGLLLCKECVEKNGGIIKVESKKGEGSTFAFTVPRATES